MTGTTEVTMENRSERHQYAEDLAEMIVLNGLSQVFGGEVVLVKRPRPHYEVAFSKPGILDGNIEIYSMTFVRLVWQTAIRTLPTRASRIYSAANAKRYIELAFIEGKYEEAEAIPQAR